MAPATSPTVLVSVVVGDRQVDLRLPAALAVAELVPEVARAAGVLDPRSGPGHRLQRVDGALLAPGLGLAAQGVADGAVLVVAPDDPPVAPPHDDLAVLVAEVVEHDLPHPVPGAARSLGDLTGAGLLGLAAFPLLALGGLPAGLAAAAVALSLVVLPRLAPHDPAGLPAVVVWPAVVHGGVAGVLLAGPAAPLPMALGAGTSLVGAVALLLAPAGRRHRFLAATVPGGVLLAAGVVDAVSGLGPAPVLVATLVLVVLAGEALPWLAATAAGLRAEPLGVEGEAAGHDRGRVAARVRSAHDVLGALAVGTGLVVAGLAPVAVARGWWGTLLAAACAALVLLRSRRHRVAATARTAVLAGLAGLGSVAVATVWWHPGGGPCLVAALLGGGVVALVGPALPLAGSARAARAAELAESLVLVSLPPLLLLATDSLDAVRRWLG